MILDEVAPDDTIMLRALQNKIMEKIARQNLLEVHKYKIWKATDGRWTTKIRDNGKLRRVKRISRTDLEDYLIQFYEDQITRITFPDAYRKWIAEKLQYGEIKPASAAKYDSDFARFFPEDNAFCRIDLRLLNAGVLERYIKSAIQEHNLTHKTYGGLRLILRGVLRYAKREGYTDFSVSDFFGDLYLPESIFTRRKPARNEEQVFYDDEAELLVKYFRNNPSLKGAGVILMFQTGLRVGELSALKPENINVQNKYIEITATETAYKDEDGKKVIRVQEEPKTADGFRRVVIPDNALTTLKMIHLLNPFGQWLFMYEDGRRIHGKAFRDTLYRACQKVGIPPRSPHKIRKTYASTLYEAGLDDKSIQLQMGHKDISTTQKSYVFTTKREDKRQKEISRIITF